MSYCQIITINKDHEFGVFETFRNAYGGAAFIWNVLCDEFLPGHIWIMGNNDKLWNLCEDLRLDAFEREVLLSTFDYAIIKRENFTKMAESFERFILKYPSKSNIICHLDKWGDAFQWLSAKNDLIGACFYHMSVSENVWAEYDLTKENKHFCIFHGNSNKL